MRAAAPGRRGGAAAQPPPQPVPVQQVDQFRPETSSSGLPLAKVCEPGPNLEVVTSTPLLAPASWTVPYRSRTAVGGTVLR